MSWQYQQSTGALCDPNGVQVAIGYSGYGADKNQPNDESIKNLGPIPCGEYSIGAPEALTGGPHGPYVLPLTPAAINVMFGRSGFLIHGDSIEHPGFASDGCIIMPRYIRERIWDSGDHALIIIA